MCGVLMIFRRGYVTLLYTVRYGSHAVYGENYAVLTVRCKSQDSVFLRLTVRCYTVRYGNLLQYYDTVYTTGYTGALAVPRRVSVLIALSVSQSSQDK